jgi:DNA-binding CsgD family transcriptional regulator/tetratricopeptide (TPR) repeat protein
MSNLFQEGLYADASRLYDEATSTQTAPLSASFLRARVYLRMNQGPEALSLLNRLTTPKSGEDYVRKLMLLGEARAVTKDPEGADHQLETALTAARTTKNSDLIADVAFRLGRRHVGMAAEPDRARELLSDVRGGKSLESKLNALHLESWILSRESRVREQARVLSEILRLLDPNSRDHIDHRVRACQTLAALAREAYLPQATSLVERHLGGLPWPDFFNTARFQTTKALAWAKALQGDYFNAFRFLKQSAAAAPDDAWRTMVLCDRAYLANARGEENWFRQELFDAEEAAEITDWEHRTDESPVALLLLAELCAPINAPQASAYLARFRSLGDVRSERSLMRDDERFRALVDYSTGVVDMHLGERKLAMSRLQNALKTYERVGFDWRAARCALRLFDVTGKETFLDIAEQRLTHYGGSWLAEELRQRRFSKPQETGLSPMREKVFRLICEGKSNVEMASLLGITVSTVANHGKAVLKEFGVNSRHALIAEAMKRNLV